MRTDRSNQAILALFSISAGLAGGFWLLRRQAATEGDAGRRWGQPRGSAQDVAEALRKDSKLGRRAIEVDAVAEGVVELTGTVRERSEAERAVGIAQRTTGVYTVVNRLVVDAEESKRAEAKRRWSEGAPDLRERHHYGMGVGMGTRRQSPSTDPDRPSDKQSMIERELDVTRFDEQSDARAGDPTTDSRVEGTDLNPGTERAIEDAGLDPSGAAPDDGSEDEGERSEAGRG